MKRTRRKRFGIKIVVYAKLENFQKSVKPKIEKACCCNRKISRPSIKIVEYESLAQLSVKQSKVISANQSAVSVTQALGK